MRGNCKVNCHVPCQSHECLYLSGSPTCGAGGGRSVYYKWMVSPEGVAGFLRRRRWIFGLRSARSGENANSDQHDNTDSNPRWGDAYQVRRDSQAENEDNEADEVRTER